MENIKYYDLTLSQNVMYFALKYSPKKNIVNIGTVLWIEEEIDIDLLEKALYKSIWRMDALRLRLKKVDGVIKQYVSTQEPKKVKIVDFTNLSKEQIDKKLTSWTGISFKYKDLELYDITIIKAKDNLTGVYVKVNHVAMDAWGLTVFIKDVMDVYAAMRDNKELPKPPAPFIPLLESDLAYKDSKKFKKDEEFWKEYFKETPKYSTVNEKYIGKKYRPTSLRFKSKLKVITLESEKVEKINEFCKENRLSPQSVFLLGSQLYLYKLNNSDEALVHNVLARRSGAAAKTAGGMLINILEFVVKCPYDLSFVDACNKIMIDQAKLFRHGDYPYQRVVDFIQKNAGIKTGNFTDLSFTYQAAKVGSENMFKAKVQNYSNGVSGISIYLTIMDALGTGNLDFLFEYNLALASEEIVDKLYDQMIKSIEIGIASPNKTLREIISEI